MTTTQTETLTVRRLGGDWCQPFRAGTDQSTFPPDTWLATVYEDDGDRYLTVAPPVVLHAWGIKVPRREPVTMTMTEALERSRPVPRLESLR